MDPVSVYLLETGFSPPPPGFAAEVPGGVFPAWGGYCNIDFALANFGHLAPQGCRLVIDGRFRAAAAHWPPRNGAMGKSLVLEEGLMELIPVLERDPAEIVILSPLWLACIIQREALAELAGSLRGGIVKISLGDAAVDVYAGGRRAFLKALRDHTEGGRPPGQLGASLFGQVLHTGFERLADLPGSLLFQGNLMQLFHNNLWLAANPGSPELHQRLLHLGEARPGDREIRIERNGLVRNSYLAEGAVVDGLVEGSVIFPDVVVGKDAVVHNSVIMSGNRIGPRAQLYKCLALPFQGEHAKNGYNVAESCTVGQKHSAATNFENSSQIRDGLTVLGMNVQLPKGFAVSSGCLVGAGVTPQRLRGMKELRKGATVLWNTDR
jgi:hypothetical protein